MWGILSVDTESDKPFVPFKPFGLTALSPQGQALGLVAECVNKISLLPQIRTVNIIKTFDREGDEGLGTGLLAVGSYSGKVSIYGICGRVVCPSYITRFGICKYTTITCAQP